jgi:hypothetical protein
MATAYDTWKTDAPCREGDEWIADRRDSLVRTWFSDHHKVSEAINAALGNLDLDDFADNLATFFCALNGKHGQDVNEHAFELRGRLMHHVRAYFQGEAEDQAIREFDNRQIGPEE